MAEKTKAAPVDTADVILALEQGEMLLADLLKTVTPTVAAVAWARGEIELGRRVRIVAGNPKHKMERAGESKPMLVVEEPFEWTGTKKAHHKSLSRILETETNLPVVERYRKYVRVRDDATGEDVIKPVAIDRNEAITLCALRVRLTDQGLASLQAA